MLCSQISELFSCIREATRALHLAGSSTDKMGAGTADPSDTVKATFEIRYLGRARVHCRKLSSDVMDTLADRLMALDEEQVMKKMEEKERRERHASGASIKVSLLFSKDCCPVFLVVSLLKVVHSVFSWALARLSTTVFLSLSPVGSSQCFHGLWPDC